MRKRKLSLADCFALATKEAAAQIPLTTDSTIKGASGLATVQLQIPGVALERTMSNSATYSCLLGPTA